MQETNIICDLAVTKGEIEVSSFCILTTKGLIYMSCDMRKGVFWVNANSKDPDQPAEIFSLIRNFSTLCYVLLYTMSLLMDSEGPDQTVWMCRLIWAFAVHICPKTHFCMARPIY